MCLALPQSMIDLDRRPRGSMASRPARLGAAVYYQSLTKRASAHTTSSAPHQTPLVYIASTLILRSMCLCLHHTVRWASTVLCSVHGFVYTPRRCANPSSSHHQSRGEGKEETRGPTALVAEYVTRRRTTSYHLLQQLILMCVRSRQKAEVERRDKIREMSAQYALQSRPGVPFRLRAGAVHAPEPDGRDTWPGLAIAVPSSPLGPAPASPSGWLWLLPKARSRRPAPPPPPFRFVAPPPRSGSRKNSVPPHLSWLASPVALLQGSTTRVPQYRAPAVRSSPDCKWKLWTRPHSNHHA